MDKAIAFVVLFALALGGCAMLSPQTCPTGLSRTTTAELFFGRNIGATEAVSDEDWRNFVETQITPRFPGGFTLSDADGAWRGKDSVTVRERAKRLFIVLSGKPDEQGKLEAIRAAYKSRFHQDGVLQLEGEGCVSF